MPNGWRFGWDGILGLIPGFGNFVTNGFSFYILIRAAVMGYPLSVVSRMGLNVLIDNVVDKIPLLGFLLDFVWKANTKNIELMDRYSLDPSQVKTQSTVVLISSLVFIFLLFVACVTATILLLSWFFNKF